MIEENKFPLAVKAMEPMLRIIQDEIKILIYELNYMKLPSDGLEHPNQKCKIANARMFDYRILPSMERLCENMGKLKMIKTTAQQLRGHKIHKPEANNALKLVVWKEKNNEQ